MVGVIVINNITNNTSTTTETHQLSRSIDVIIFRQKDSISFTGYKLPCRVNKGVPLEQSLVLGAPRSFGSHFGVSIHVYRRIASLSPVGGAIAIGGLASKRVCDRR